MQCEAKPLAGRLRDLWRYELVISFNHQAKVVARSIFCGFDCLRATHLANLMNSAKALIYFTSDRIIILIGHEI
jgi:hypothetical protein